MSYKLSLLIKVLEKYASGATTFDFNLINSMLIFYSTY